MAEEENKFAELEKSLIEELDRIGRVQKNLDGTTTYRSLQYNGALGDFATEWWTEKDWENHRKEIEKMKADGTYMKPFISSMTMQHNPMFDEPNKPKGKMSFSFEIMDMSKLKK